MTYRNSYHSVFQQLENDNKNKLYQPTNDSSCSQCHSNVKTYYIGTFTRQCSDCIEQTFISKFTALFEDYKKYKTRKE